MRIDIVSDTVCPWCYVGKRHLEKAMSQRPDLQFAIHWLPFQLNPQIPLQGVDRKTYWREKFGGDQRMAGMVQHLGAIGKSLDLAFDFERIKTQPNTLKSHMLLHWQAGSLVQNQLKEAILDGFFVRGLDIGNEGVLLDLAQTCDLDRDTAEKVLNDSTVAESVRQLDGEARRRGISGVPTFIFGGQAVIVGAQPDDALLEVIDKFAS